MLLFPRPLRLSEGVVVVVAVVMMEEESALVVVLKKITYCTVNE